MTQPMQNLSRDHQNIVQDMEDFLEKYKNKSISYGNTSVDIKTEITNFILDKKFLDKLPKFATKLSDSESEKGILINCLMYFRYYAPAELLKDMFGISRDEAYVDDKQSPNR